MAEKLIIMLCQESNDFQLDVEDFCNTLEREGADLCVICNPNNPTSTATAPSEMRKILSRCRELGIFVMIDETYAEFAPVSTSISSVGLLSEFENFTIMRGISKFFAAPRTASWLCHDFQSHSSSEDSGR